MRGVAAAGLLVFISALGFFITPTLLGSPREMMLGQLIIVQINELQNWQLGSALAVVLVISAFVSCFLYNLVFGMASLVDDRESKRPAHHRHMRTLGNAIVNGLGFACSQVLAPWDKYVRPAVRVSPPAIYSWLLIAVLLFPIVAIVPMAFTADTFLSFPPKGFSLRWFVQYFDSTLWIGVTLRSFGIGLLAAFFTAVIATMAALGIARSKSRGTGALFLLFLLPMIVPSIVTAIVLFYL
ncbi:Spermidine Putrescine ABC transporter permease component potC [Candidatus Burkholderia verschuerenii]|uniref:Spermidine Putrescine ABC transporter permease component potC n=1 Tax=Candidatus Burkholderia verschuerenii TaxID=242163 RepID=A0A0L0MHD2_9BURK|nr:hypothetical protein [Candidatus Burkholderia verschuerenii]KND62072.1 Spermidine Putrescine ABC transporter permease component potC [Candidatus Burkholderia verschuerenii]